MKCNICGKKATIKDVDPCDDELNGGFDSEGNELEEEWWCEECYESRRYDV